MPRTYRLPLAKLTAAQRALGATTATETIERALDLVVFQRDLVDGTRAMLGVRITPTRSERRKPRISHSDNWHAKKMFCSTHPFEIPRRFFRAELCVT